MAMLSTRSWWLTSRVLLWSRVSISLVFVYHLNSRISTSQSRMFERADTSRCRLHRGSFSRPFRLCMHHLTTNSGVAYSSMPRDGLPAYGTAAPPRPAQQTPQTLRSSIAYLALQIYFQPELQPPSTECICPVTLDLYYFPSFVFAIHPQIFESGVDYIEPV